MIFYKTQRLYLKLIMTAVKFKLWVEGKEDVFLGNGRVKLLEAIKAEGSITAAAKSMNMSYKKAWEQINSMNELSSKPVVLRNSGGKGGGGTELTQHGEKLIEQFRAINASCQEFIKSESKKYSFN